MLQLIWIFKRFIGHKDLSSKINVQWRGVSCRAQYYNQKTNIQKEDLTRVVDLYATNHQAFVNIMMLSELGLVVTDEVVAQVRGCNIFSFIIVGGIPALP